MTTSIQKLRTKSAQISLRIPSELRPLIAHAAAVRKISVNRFIEDHRSEAARQVVQKHDSTQTDSHQP